jgi:polyphosphate glucokinase
MKVLAIDIGGSHVKIMATGHRKKRKANSGPAMSARDIYVPLHYQVIVWAMRDEPELPPDLQNVPHFAWRG